MSVYNDMASDAGYRYGTPENEQLASMIEADEFRKQQEREYEASAAEEEEEKQANAQQTISAAGAKPPLARQSGTLETSGIV